MSTDLASLATETSAQLREIWALIGCAQPEQDSFLTDLTARVASVYKDAVAGQEARQKGIEAEIDSLQSTIRSLNGAMGETEDGIVSRRIGYGCVGERSFELALRGAAWS